MIKILELRSTYGYGGGPDKTILYSAARHDPVEFRIDVAYLRGAGDADFSIGRRALEIGVKIEEFVDSGKIDFRVLRKLAEKMRNWGTNIVHGHDYKSNLYALLLSRMVPGVCPMATAHGWAASNAKSSLYNWVDKRVLRRMPLVIAVSDATRSILTDNGIDPDRIELLYNGIDESVWSRRLISSDIRKEFSVPADAPFVGTIGRLSGEKDLGSWLRVARTLLDTMPESHFIIVGDGPLRETVVALRNQLNLVGRLHLPGYRKDLPEIYNSLDVHLMTSTTEGLPNSLLEAMALEVPTVSTAVGGIAEIVVPPQNGLLLEPGDVAGLAAAVTRLLTDRAFASGIASAARQSIETQFSFAGRTRAIEALYRRLAARS